MMIRILEARYLGDFQIRLHFSDGAKGILNGHLLLQNRGSLLEPLRDEAYFRRFFTEAGALCWPNGLELSPARLHETCQLQQAA